MRNKFVVTMLCLAITAGTAAAAEKTEFKTKKEKTSYAVGYNMGLGLKRSLEAQSIEVDLEVIKQGVADAFAGTPPLVQEQEIRDILTELQKDYEAKRKEALAKQQEKMKEMGEKNKKEGDAFLKENAKKSGIKVLPSGLQYKILSEGKGKKPSPSDTVTVNYKGMLIDGTEFDSSYKRGQPATFGLNQVIKGWTEGIPLIKEGGKIQLFIPPDLGYGDRGAGQLIGPNAVLIFEVELLSTQPQPAVQSGQ